MRIGSIIVKNPRKSPLLIVNGSPTASCGYRLLSRRFSPPRSAL
jgi:hypothetical protein